MEKERLTAHVKVNEKDLLNLLSNWSGQDLISDDFKIEEIKLNNGEILIDLSKKMFDFIIS